MSEKARPKTGFAEVNGARLYYEVAGKGFPMLLLHAGVADSRMWDPQWEEFSQYYRVIRTDLRGFGKTVVPAGLFSYHEDLATLLRFLEAERAFVVGLSFGGQVAIDFALAHPEMVAALVLGAPAIDGHEPSAELQRFSAQEEELLERGDIEGATELNLCTWVDGPFRGPDEVDPAVREWVREMQMDVFEVPVPDEAEDEWLDPPAIERLEEISVPTLIIVGELDQPDFRQIANTLAIRIPGAEKVVVPGVAHLPSLEKPEEFNRIVLRFLRTHQR